MSGLRSLLLVARRELVERARSRAFLASTLVTLVIVAFLIVGPRLFGGDDTMTVGLTGRTPDGLREELEEQAAALDLDVEVRSYRTGEEAEAALTSDEADAVVAGGSQILWKADTDPQLEALLRGSLQRIDVQRRAAELRLDPAAATALLAPAKISSRSLEPVTPDVEARRQAAVVAMILLFVAINMYGSFVLMGVVEEKSSRVVEVLLARTEPPGLLAGKVLGIGLLGLVQIVLLGVVALTALAVLPEGDTPLPDIGVGLVGWLALWFILGYALYSMAYGAVGALASRMEDAQSAAGPLTMILLAGYFVTFATVTSSDTGPGSVAVGLIPLTAPFAMPMRLAVGAVALWEVVASIVFMLASIFGLARLAGRVYRGAILRVGAKVKLRDAWRAVHS
jgi:ABC-2 type transport system permease protein